MRPLSLLSYSQCRYTLFKASRESWITLASLSFRRHRSGGNSKNNKRSNNHEARKRPTNYHRAHLAKVEPTWPSFEIPEIDINNIPAFFEAQVKEWSYHRALPSRLQSFGVPEGEVRPLLNAFVRAVTAGKLSTPEGQQKYVLSRFVQHLDDENPLHTIDTIYSTILFTWASETAQVEHLRSVGLSQHTINRIQALASASDRWFPAEEFPVARRLHRKIIMHVGPTNSGKTHNALRALAAAGTGVYAGPLRLLAHEIWERLNRGQIMPAGIEEEEPPKETTIGTDTALDVATARRLGNPKYARLCNMRTGEEHRIVDEDAPLISCTVEMLNGYREYDVAVIDEIQMLADPERGGAWTSAVLGVAAKEVHLCGEEAAVPVVEALLKDTGDELIVNRYQRLSPLHVQEESLNGDWGQVKKGDCVVTFSRGSIFNLKREIETKTSLRCAVVYGRLPPEIRSEQAALFNDPNSGYDVLIGSDAIGMGLNLKIRRVIFESTTKFHGTREAPLSISQIKQIAGRAGRYGLHGNDQAGGYVTSFLPNDIPPIQKALDALPQPLQTARIGISTSSFRAFALALPHNSLTKTVIDANYYISRIPAYLRQQYVKPDAIDHLCNFIDERLATMPTTDAMLFLLAPVPARDPAALEIIHRFFRAYQDIMVVDLWDNLEGSPLLAALDAVESLQTEAKPEGVNSKMVLQLESLHKAVVIYVWMTFRRPVAWPCVEEVVALKLRLEKALDWGLQALTKSQPGKDWEKYLEEYRTAKEGVAYRQRYVFEKYRDQSKPLATSSEGPSATELEH